MWLPEDRQVVLIAPLDFHPENDVMSTRCPSSASTDQLNARLGVLTRREVEARILKPLIEALCTEFGDRKVLDLVKATIVQIAQEQGRQLQEQAPVNDLQAFAATLDDWQRDDAMVIDVLQHTDTEFHFDVKRCRYAEMYRSLGMAELGSILSCQRDHALIQGFNEEVELERTQTIMEGASHCDFRYRLRKAPITLQ